MSDEHPPPAEGPRRRGRVLIIDDEVNVGTAARRVLSGENDVRLSTGSDEALGWLRAGERFDVILCDVLMPYQTGIDFYRHVAREMPDVLPRIVLMTGGIFSAQHYDQLESIPNLRLEKPISPTHLRELVRSYVAR